MSDVWTHQLPPEDPDLPWTKILAHLEEPQVMAQRREVHDFLRLSLELAIARLGDKEKFAAHPWPTWRDMTFEIERRGKSKDLTPGKFKQFWKTWEDFRLDQSAYAIATARSFEISTAPTRWLLDGLNDVLARRIRFSELVLKVAHLDDQLRQRTAISFLLQAAPILDATCRETAQEVHREFYRRRFELWLKSFHEVLEALGFRLDDGVIRDLLSQLIALADGLADRIARTGDASHLYASNGSSLLGQTALQLFWAITNSEDANIADLVNGEVEKRLPEPPPEPNTEEDA